ncbi:MAG: hypothetical protein QXX03_08265 [Nitrososphaerota archaeon]
MKPDKLKVQMNEIKAKIKTKLDRYLLYLRIKSANGKTIKTRYPENVDGSSEKPEDLRFDIKPYGAKVFRKKITIFPKTDKLNNPHKALINPKIRDGKDKTATA